MAKVQSIAIPLTIVDESTAIVSATQVIPSGFLVGVASTAGALDGSDTYTVKITDVNSVTIYEVGSLAESSTVFDISQAFAATEETPLRIPCVGPVTVTITASAEQNTADVDFTVYLYIEA